MNNRIAKKILMCVSALHTNQKKVLIARRQVFNNPKYFKNKGIYIIENEFCQLNSFKT